MITTFHFEGAYATWKGQARFLIFVDQPNTINIEKSKIGVLLELSSRELYSYEEIHSIIDNHQCKMKCIIYIVNLNIFWLKYIVTKPVSGTAHH
jgi:hypothetical protein